AHMDAGELLAFDVVHRRIVKTIAAPGVPGVIAVPALGRVYASATNAPEVVTVDADAGDLLARAAAGQYPDGLRPGRAPRLRLGRERRRRDGPDGAGRGIATIPLGGEAGNVHPCPSSATTVAASQAHTTAASTGSRRRRAIARPRAGPTDPSGIPGCRETPA